ncbi:MAG: SUF system Fe-S cluster assembly regulator [Pseudomonadota bacterium]
MIRLSNMADYAVVIMCRAARMTDSRHNAADMAAATGVPAATAAKLMSALARAGLLASHRGVAGGFTLARPATAISMADIIEAVDGPIAMTNCIEHGPGDCTLESFCVMRPHWQAINGAIKSALAEVSLAEIAAPYPISPTLMADAATGAHDGRGREGR